MSGGEVQPDPGNLWQQITAIAVVILLGAFGGVLTQALMYGFEFKTGKIGPLKLKRLQDKIQVPPLVGMIVMGCLARNFLPFDWMQYYPETMASYMRMETLAIILMIGGLELDFAGKGLTVVLLTLCP